MKLRRGAFVAAATVALSCLAVWFLLADRSSDNTAFAKEQSQSGKAALGFSSPTTEPGSTASLPTARVETVMQDCVLSLTGTLEADEQSEVASTTDGIVQEVKVERGSIVKKDDVLVVVDPRDAENRLSACLAALEEIRVALDWDGVEPYRLDEHTGVRTARAELDLQKANWERFSGLEQKGAVSTLKRDQARTDYETAQQRYREARSQANRLYHSYRTALEQGKMLKKALDDTIIRAPFSGMVVEKYVSAGERVTTTPIGSGDTVARLVKIDRLRLVLSVSQQHAMVAREGQTVKFRAESCSEQEFTATVKYVAPSIDKNSRALIVEAIVDNADLTLRPGLFVTADLILPDKKQAFAIPASAVVKMGDVAKVYTIREDAIVEKIVATGQAQRDRMIVTAGLAADDVVVTQPELISKPGNAS